MPAPAKTYEDEFRAVYERQCHYYGYNTRKKQEKVLHITADTLGDYLKNPGMFRQKHLRQLYRVLNFTEKEQLLLNKSGRMNGK